MCTHNLSYKYINYYFLLLELVVYFAMNCNQLAWQWIRQVIRASDRTASSILSGSLQSDLKYHGVLIFVSSFQGW